MKKWALCLLLLAGLCGCSAESKELEQGLELRTRMLDASGFSFDTDITADYGDKLHQLSMSCQADSEGNVTFTVTAPETIAGITGRITREGGALIFEETALHFDLLADEQLSPVSAPWVLVKTLRSGYLRFAGREEEGIRLTIDDSYEEDALMLDIWLDPQNLPERAEILYDGRRILTMLVKNPVIL
jgi:hypothetical protein